MIIIVTIYCHHYPLVWEPQKWFSGFNPSSVLRNFPFSAQGSYAVAKIELVLAMCKESTLSILFLYGIYFYIEYIIFIFFEKINLINYLFFFLKINWKKINILFHQKYLLWLETWISRNLQMKRDWKNIGWEIRIT